MSTEQIRLLLCLECSTIEELPDYEGDPREDHLLEVLISKHEYPSGLRHLGDLIKLDKAVWDNKNSKREVIKQIRKGSGGIDEFDAKFYETKNTFMEDALHCWKVKHNRTINCGDYRSEPKRLVPDTKDDWKQAGVTRPKKTAFDRYLCDFCPYHRVVVETEKHKRGLD